MEQITIIEPTGDEPNPMTPEEINATPGALHFEQAKVPGLGFGRILPVGLSDRLHQWFRRETSPSR